MKYSLETAVKAYSFSIGEKINSNSYNVLQNYSLQNNSRSYKTQTADVFLPEEFLMPSRPLTHFVFEAKNIMGLVEQAFFATTKQKLPENIMITVAARELLQQRLPQFTNTAVVGLSLNNSTSVSEIFVVSSSLDAVMITIGHEIGHVITSTLANQQQEEKAFAFQAAWSRAIFENDIGGLRSCIKQDFSPARNGVHDFAFSLVKNILNSGEQPLQLFNRLQVESIDELVSGESIPAISADNTYYERNKNPVAVVYEAAAKILKRAEDIYHTYRNATKDAVIHFIKDVNFQNLGKGLYGVYNTVTGRIAVNEELKKNLTELHRTIFHELVHKFAMAEEYVARAIEKAAFSGESRYDKELKRYVSSSI
jgi:hypothetical protein